MSESIVPLALAMLALTFVLAMGYVVLRFQQHNATTQTVQVIVNSYATSSTAGEPTLVAAMPLHQRLLAATTERLTTTKQRQRLQRLLDYAGQPDASSLAKALRDKAALALTGVALGCAFGIAAGGWAWIALPALGAAGFWLPDLLAYNAGLRRTEALRRSLPDAIELLSLCVQSGMGFQAALAQVAAYQEGPVAQEFARVLREMQLGQSRQGALDALGKRSHEEDLNRFVAAVLQADRLGIAISAVLTEQAAELRSKRRDRARESAQKVPVKILLPVIACFLPGIFIIVLGPASLSLFRLFSST